MPTHQPCRQLARLGRNDRETVAGLRRAVFTHSASPRLARQSATARPTSQSPQLYVAAASTRFNSPQTAREDDGLTVRNGPQGNAPTPTAQFPPANTDGRGARRDLVLLIPIAGIGAMDLRRSDFGGVFALNLAHGERTWSAT